MKQPPAIACINRKHFKLPLLPKVLQQQVPLSYQHCPSNRATGAPPRTPYFQGASHTSLQGKRSPRVTRCAHSQTMLWVPGNPCPKGLMPTSSPSPGPVDTRGHPSAGGQEAPPGPRGGGGSLVRTHRPGVERELVLRRLGALAGTVVPGLTNVKASLRVQIL